LSIDGLQPEKGHETLYVVRELGRQRVWFAKPLLSSATTEIRPLIVQAKEWAERLGCRIRLWMSDKQDAFVSAIASVCPGVPHRYCSNHFLRDLAKPVLELDSHAKAFRIATPMRKAFWTRRFAAGWGEREHSAGACGGTQRARFF
jgi:hypothetical protein